MASRLTRGDCEVVPQLTGLPCRPAATFITKVMTALAAGQCLLFEATRNGYSLIGVTLHSPGSITDLNRADATRILNWAFGLRS